ncbi:hypothetical protein V6N13_026899 [Hibiscus sabdariffa]
MEDRGLLAIRPSFASSTQSAAKVSQDMSRKQQGNVEKKQQRAPRFAPELDGLHCFETLVEEASISPYALSGSKLRKAILTTDGRFEIQLGMSLQSCTLSYFPGYFVAYNYWIVIIVVPLCTDVHLVGILRILVLRPYLEVEAFHILQCRH